MTATATPPRASAPDAPPPFLAPAEERQPRAWLARAPRLLTLVALGAYAAVRWATLVRPQATVALLGLLLLALVLTAAVHGLGRLPRHLDMPAGALLAFVWLALAALISGAPSATVLEPRHWGDLTAGIQQGLADLPGLLVPYQAANPWPRVTILLGGGLLLTVAVLLASFGRRGGDGRRLLAALPLLVLTIVPATIIHQTAPVLNGTVLFALLAAFLWLDRLPRRAVPIAVGLVVAAGVAGVLVAPALRAKPWVNAQHLVDGLSRTTPSTFDWSQHYGPLDSPRSGQEVLSVRSPRPLYWKTEDLDGFDGLHWVTGGDPQVIRSTVQEVPTAALMNPRWSTTISVKLGQMTSTNVIGAGTTLSFRPAPDGLTTTGSPGTYTTTTAMKPGTSYLAEVIDAQPSRHQMATAGTNFPALLDRYRDVGLPRQSPSGSWTTGGQTVRFPTFAAHGGEPSGSAAQLVAGTPYADVATLADRLASESSTPYAYVRNVLDYLRHGYTYNETPPTRPVPLEAFLFRDREGYCQQFAGAAALLLRMGGLPTRVATGFTSGTPDGTGNYVVRDEDAHAWVEVWFPRYGWVTFDPTPPSAPALSSSASRSVSAVSPAPAAGTRSAPVVTPHRDTPEPAATPSSPTGDGLGAGSGASGTPWGWIAAGAVAVLLVAAGLLGAMRRRRRAVGPEGDRLLAELERALRRTGRSPAEGLTLQQLERRFKDSPDAAAYVRTLRLARYAGGDPHVTAGQRRALRTELGQGLGVVGRLRALLALPPRLH